MDGKFVSPGTPLTDSQRELLTIFMEECDEVTELCAEAIKQASKASQSASKALRFGLDETQPGQPFDNAQRLGHEIGDLYRVAERMMVRGIVDESDVEEGFNNKEKKLAKFMQHSAQEGE
ncbi:hypothetical protein [Terasakiella pusilla]|uniref:hypothetical protein n=1 Tax=Terasakiella pusilla TaxID=64973 RepID=UPI003AA88B1C